MAKETPKRSYYAIIPAFVRYDKDLTPNAKLLYGEITALCNEKGHCWATNSYFSDLYGVSETSISKWISNLIKKGYVLSTIVYKEGKKEIDHRCLTIVNGGIEEKLNTPLEEKLKDNNTIGNNTLKENIIKESVATITHYTSEDFNYWFEATYSIYPRKVSKVQAKESFEHKLRGLEKEEARKKAGAIYRMLETQNNIWQNENNGEGRKIEHIPHFSTWANANVEDSPHYKRGRK